MYVLLRAKVILIFVCFPFLLKFEVAHLTLWIDIMVKEEIYMDWWSEWQIRFPISECKLSYVWDLGPWLVLLVYAVFYGLWFYLLWGLCHSYGQKKKNLPAHHHMDRLFILAVAGQICGIKMVLFTSMCTFIVVVSF